MSLLYVGVLSFLIFYHINKVLALGNSGWVTIEQWTTPPLRLLDQGGVPSVRRDSVPVASRG